MKIFVCGPYVGDCLTHNIAYTLRMAGHEVHSEPSVYYRMKRGDFWGKALSQINEKFGIVDKIRPDWIYKSVKMLKPDLIIVGTNTLSPSLVLDLKRYCRGPVVCWYCDAPANIRGNHIVSGEYDAVFLKDFEYATSLRNMLKINAYPLDEACNPAWHRPPNSGTIGTHLTVAGTMYGYRERLVLNLVRAGISLNLYGPSPSSWSNPATKAMHTGMYLDEKTKARLFFEALGCLNTFAPAERDSLNCRVFETCGCGGLLISEKRHSIYRCFDPDSEFLEFDSMEELLQILEKLKSDPGLGMRVRLEGMAKAHSHHTYAKRLSAIFRTLGLKYAE